MKVSPTIPIRWARSTPTATITRRSFPINSSTTARATRNTRWATSPTPRFPTKRSRSPSDRMARADRRRGLQPTTASRIMSSQRMPAWARSPTRNGSRATAIRSPPRDCPTPTQNRIYMMNVTSNGHGSKPYVQTAVALKDGSHTDWTPAVELPTQNSNNNNTYLLPHIDPAGVVYTSLINFVSGQSSCCVDVLMDYSTNGGRTWIGPSVAASNVHVPPLTGAGYVNTTFEDGIEET